MSVSLSRRMDREEYQRWVERVSQGFQRGEVVELSLKYVRNIMMASKGNIAVATPKHLFILVNLPYNEYQRLLDLATTRYGNTVLKDFKVACSVIKSVPERKFTLCEAREFRITYQYTRSYEDFVIEKENERYEVEGAELVVSEGVRRRFQEVGEVVIQWSGRGFRMFTEVRGRVKLGEDREQRVVWRVTDPSKPLGGFLARNQELLRTKPSAVCSDMLLFTDKLVVRVRARENGITVETYDVEIPADGELLECSRFYSIVVPRLYIFNYNGFRASRILKLDVYYKGFKRTVTLNYVPDNLLFRCLRMRYSISTYARRVLPRGKAYIPIDLDLFHRDHARRISGWTRMIREEILPKVKNLHSEPRNIDPVEAFCELWYVNTPKRKVENVVRPWIEIYEKVKDLAPKSTLYITFYGQVRRRPNFVGFKVDRDGFITLMTSRYVPVSGITMKGGEFERLYRENYVKKLFEYQIVPREEKLRILREDVEEVRRMLRDASVEPATASLKEFKEKLLGVAKEYDGDNIVLLALKHLDDVVMRTYVSRTGVSPNELQLLIIGLVKSGKYPEDYRRFAELGGLEYLRMVVKYEMKRRGYSIKKGVMFLGSPSEVRRRILEVVKGLRGRLLALMEEFGEAGVEVPMAERLGRVEALLSF